MTSGDLKWKKTAGFKVSHMPKAFAIAVRGIHLRNTHSSFKTPEAISLMGPDKSMFEVVSETYYDQDSTLLCILFYLGV